MNRVIFNQKGGVGKSTIACNLAAINGATGKKTLLIDLDTQGNSSQYLLGKKVVDSDQTIACFFKNCLGLVIFGDKSDLSPIIHKTPFPNLYVIPSHPDLEGLQSRLASRYKIFKLKEALAKLSSYDIYIDTPPVLNFYSQSALVAANKCLIPFDCDSFAREALYTSINTVTEIKADHNDALEIEGIIVNQFQKQAKLPHKLVKDLVDEGHRVLNSKISSSVVVRESHSHCKPLIYYQENHKLSDEYRALYNEIQQNQTL